MTSITETPSEVRVGDMLRTVRTERGVSLATVSKDLLIPEKYLQSVEDMYISGIPQGYLNGILRNYAAYLTLPTEDIIAKFSEQCGVLSQAPTNEDVVASNVRTRSTVRGAVAGFSIAVGLTLVAGLGFAVLGQSDDGNPVSNATITAVQAPANGAHDSLFLALEQDAVLPQLPLTLTATRTAWLEVRGADGTIFRSRNMSAGETYHPRIGAGWSVSAQDGGAFLWEVGQIEIGFLGEEDTPVYAVNVDGVAAHAQTIAAPALAGIVDGRPAR